MTTSLGYKFEATAAAEFSDVRAACFQDQRRFRSCACICDRRSESEWTDRTNSEFASIPAIRALQNLYPLEKMCACVGV